MIKKIKIIEKIIKIILIISIVLTILIFVFNFLIDKEPKELKVANSIENYNYILLDRDIELYKIEFEKLKELLNKDVIDYEEYSNSIAKLFIIDLYTLNNKNSSYDVGGLQFVHKDLKDNLSLNASNTLYKYLNSSNSKLPQVKEITISSNEETTYEHLDKEFVAYKVSLNWTYEKDYEYEKEGTLIIIKEEDKLYIVEKIDLSV